jgi:hypothetical protein
VGSCYSLKVEGKRTLIADVQSDILPVELVAKLQYIATTSVTIGPHSYCISHRMLDGRGKREICTFQDGKFLQIDSDDVQVTQPSLQPTSTFNLGMTADQAAVKAKVILPHYRVRDAPDNARPILAEDYDEEDPDDDLEF